MFGIDTNSLGFVIDVYQGLDFRDGDVSFDMLFGSLEQIL